MTNKPINAALLMGAPEKEREGVWLHFRAGWRCKLRRSGTREFEELQSKKMRALVRQHGTEAAREHLDTLGKELIAEYLVVDWDPLEDVDGTPIACTPAKVLEMLDADEWFDWSTWVSRQVTVRANFERDDAKALLGNSETGSSSPSDTGGEKEPGETE